MERLIIGVDSIVKDIEMMRKSRALMSNNALRPKIVLAIAAHPDDIEFGASGSIAKYISMGAKVYYYILTDASKGTHDRRLSQEKLISIRRKEQRDACDILGVSDVMFGDYVDGEVKVTQGLKRDIVKTIRNIKPDTVITMDPSMLYSSANGFINHPDHRAVGQATLDAVYPLARDFLAFPKLFNEDKLEPHETKTILLINFDNNNYFEDISNQIDLKLKALAAHKSQLPDESAILAMVRQGAAENGKIAGYNYAEKFIRIDIA